MVLSCSMFSKAYLILCFFSYEHDIFIIKQIWHESCNVIVENVNLTQDVKKENYNHHDGEQLFFIKKVTHSKRKDVLVIFILLLYIIARKEERTQFVW